MGILNSQSHFEIGSDVEEVIVSEYGRCLEGEYVRRRLRVKALGMAEASVDAPAGAAGESGMSITNIEVVEVLSHSWTRGAIGSRSSDLCEHL